MPNTPYDQDVYLRVVGGKLPTNYEEWKAALECYQKDSGEDKVAVVRTVKSFKRHLKETLKIDEYKDRCKEILHLINKKKAAAMDDVVDDEAAEDDDVDEEEAPG